MEWNFKHEESSRVAVGDTMCVIVSAEECISKTSGKSMIKVGVRPSNSNAKIYTYFVEGEHFNKNMTNFFEAFPNIEEGNFNLPEWIGNIGGVKLGTDEKGYLKVKWFLSPSQCEKLPEFVGTIPEKQTVTNFEEMNDGDDLPF